MTAAGVVLPATVFVLLAMTLLVSALCVRAVSTRVALSAAATGVFGLVLVRIAALDPLLAGGWFQFAVQSTIFSLGIAVLMLAAFISALVSLRARFRRRDSLALIPSVDLVERSEDTRTARLRRLLRGEHDKAVTANEMHRYLEMATANSQITIYLQNTRLQYLWIVNPRMNLGSGNVLGLTDEDLIPPDMQPLVIGHKMRAIKTGTKQTFELELPDGADSAWFRVDVVPIREDGEDVTGIVCAAIDITRAKRLDMMRTDLSRRLAETLQRFNLALRSEKISVFSQDLTMRYTWANADETLVGSLIGRTDEDVLLPSDLGPIAKLKRGAIESKRPQSGEIGVGEGGDRRWYDLHVEPNIRTDGQVTGITCASIDITDRKRNEEHMRLVMRELTHRTKNLLAVVIAIARQTSANATDTEAFVTALIGRLRALSAAQDLIVADDWAGVAVDDLVNVLLRQSVASGNARVKVDGPRLIISPEAAQNFGLAIHELITNAVNYGSLSSPTGLLSVSWTVRPDENGEEEISLHWSEEKGPAAKEPDRRGFGMMVIERSLARALKAKVTLDFAPDGLCAEIRMPTAGLLPQTRGDQEKLAQVN
ncbi:HWE histidine kinase domain-containing protein [Acuticoccus sp. MNP-M23]|uniref:sensor histidine kinase n=1 Tax=Acuticoccus sp. MNP-M23 TaxID=3072793 RepID=UPI0028166A3D|nr:HWE histidine kinase domain-containing protein [Acuticoccus sp. MNP-M23]WMS42084.1 HWE histidine kinase domain-containing protein [Acuticoccus sp. MNP-M23]